MAQKEAAAKGDKEKEKKRGSEINEDGEREAKRVQMAPPGVPAKAGVVGK